MATTKAQAAVYNRRRWANVQAIRDARLVEQGGVCAICGSDDPGNKLGWQLDHDHSCCPTRSRAIACKRCYRGVLCYYCNNQLLPALERNPDVVALALEYLEKYGD